ncbi:MAG: Nucleolar protein 12 [Thelocarpon impressellum]|nr:MAG: Nucleolar protein 12 [Thelocarpon impressellum]
MRRIAQEEAKEKARRKEEGSRKRQKSHGDTPEGGSLSSVDVPGADRATLDHETPQHESLGPSKDSTEIEKASRTVFLSNVSTLAITSKSAKKKLIGHLSSFLPLPVKTGEDEATHKVESLRFRSTAFSSAVLPKRAAFARKELMDATTKSTNAYAVYTTAVAAREAVKRINGTVVLDRHMRVDGVAHPAKIDHRRCVFVGNLGFVDDESLMDAAEEGEGKRKRSKVPSDVEEGLWRQFGKAGKVESVRVVRDPKTRVGKGIAYVQFEDANAVEAALLYNEKKFPPALPRILRVTRAKSLQKTWSKANATATARPAHGKPNRIYVAKPSSEVQSFKGRAGKLLGRAGAAKVAAGDQGHGAGRRETPGVAKSPEQVVFEGYRASRNAGRSGLKTGASGKKKGKPKTRSSKRGTAWKAAEGRGK